MPLSVCRLILQNTENFKKNVYIFRLKYMFIYVFLKIYEKSVISLEKHLRILYNIVTVVHQGGT